MKDKTICITGITDGLGKEIIQLLANDHNTFILLGRNEKKLERIKNMISELSKESIVTSYTCDFSSLKDVHKVAKQISEDFTSIDYLIHNAGSVPSSIGQKTNEGLDFSLSVNYLSPLIITHALIDNLSQSTAPVIYYTTTQMMPKTFELAELDRTDTLPIMKIYAISKLMFCLYLEDLSQNTSFSIRVFDPTTMYTNTLTNVIPKGLNWASPFVRLFVRSARRVAVSAVKVLNQNTGRGIFYYTLEKMRKPIKILKNKELQEESILYGKKLLD